MLDAHKVNIHKKKVNILILCGGLGSRISKITKKTPKPLIKIFGKPFLYYLIKNLTRYNFDKFYLLTHYKSDDFIKFKSQYEDKINTKIKIIKEKIKLDTGGAVINAINKINNNNDFILLNGDTYLDINYDLLYEQYKKTKKIFMPLVNSSKESQKLNFLGLNKKKEVCFSKTKFMNSGVYVFNKKNITEFLKIKKCSFENSILKKKIYLKQVQGEIFTNNFIDIGSYSSLKKIKKFINDNFFYKKILFLDRDNTINFDAGYTYKIKDLRLIKKNIKFIRKKYENFLKVIVTNQSGIGRGYFTLQKFKIFMNKLELKLKSYNVHLSRIYYCPHHKEANMNKYKLRCKYRKPNMGMAKKAFKDLDIKKGKNCLLIGNDKNDNKLAKHLKIKYLDQIKIL